MIARPLPRGRGFLLLLVLATAFGIVLGWFASTASLAEFDALNAYLSPISGAALGIHALVTQSKRSRWTAALFLVTVMLGILRQSPLDVLGGMGLAAGAVGVVSSLCRARVPAIAATLICGLAAVASVCVAS